MAEQRRKATAKRKRRKPTNYLELDNDGSDTDDDTKKTKGLTMCHNSEDLNFLFGTAVKASEAATWVH